MPRGCICLPTDESLSEASPTSGRFLPTNLLASSRMVYRIGLSGFTTLLVRSHLYASRKYISTNDYSGATTFGRVWADPNNPVWKEDIKFHKGTCVYKVRLTLLQGPTDIDMLSFQLLFTTASDEQVPTMKGSPTWNAVRLFPSPFV